jgi:hypothetical protein
LINGLAVVTSSIVDVHWQKLGVTSHFQRNVFETQPVNITYISGIIIQYIFLYISVVLGINNEHFQNQKRKNGVYKDKVVCCEVRVKFCGQFR